METKINENREKQRWKFRKMCVWSCAPYLFYDKEQNLWKQIINTQKKTNKWFWSQWWRIHSFRCNYLFRGWFRTLSFIFSYFFAVSLHITQLTFSSSRNKKKKLNSAASHSHYIAFFFFFIFIILPLTEKKKPLSDAE